MPTHKIEIVFITVMDRVAVMTRRIHRPDPTPASTKVNWVYTGLPARSCDRIGIPGWVLITEALAIARVGVVLVEINYCCLGASVSKGQRRPNP